IRSGLSGSAAVPTCLLGPPNSPAHQFPSACKSRRAQSVKLARNRSPDRNRKKTTAMARMAKTSHLSTVASQPSRARMLLMGFDAGERLLPPERLGSGSFRESLTPDDPLPSSFFCSSCFCSERSSSCFDCSSSEASPFSFFVVSCFSFEREESLAELDLPDWLD